MEPSQDVLVYYFYRCHGNSIDYSVSNVEMQWKMGMTSPTVFQPGTIFYS